MISYLNLLTGLDKRALIMQPALKQDLPREILFFLIESIFSLQMKCGAR